MSKKKSTKPRGKNVEKIIARRGLTDMQALFIREYLVDKNATAAAKRAGYSDETAGQLGWQNLQIPSIRSAIDSELRSRYSRLDITAERVLHEIMLLATVDIGEAYDDHGALLPVKAMPENIRRAIAGVEVYEEKDSDGNKIGETSKLKLIDKKGALELLAKNLKLLTDKIEHTGKDGAPLGGHSDEELDSRLQALLDKSGK